MSHSELYLKDASIEEIAKVASDIIYQNKIEKKKSFDKGCLWE